MPYVLLQLLLKPGYQLAAMSEKQKRGTSREEPLALCLTSKSGAKATSKGR